MLRTIIKLKYINNAPRLKKLKTFITTFLLIINIIIKNLIIKG
jgi:hypothetical protein